MGVVQASFELVKMFNHITTVNHGSFTVNGSNTCENCTHKQKSFAVVFKITGRKFKILN